MATEQTLADISIFASDLTVSLLENAYGMRSFGEGQWFKAFCYTKPSSGRSNFISYVFQ